MSVNLIVSAFWMEGDPDDCTEAMGLAATTAGAIKGSGAVVSISEAEALKLGRSRLYRDLAVFQLQEAADFPGAG